MQKILEDEDTLDLLKAAEAISAEKEKKPEHIPSRENSLKAWAKLKQKRREEEEFRQKLAKAWNKKFNSPT
jgi:hypothetical protein